MEKSVTLVEINVWDNMTPLVSGYLEAYASVDPLLRADYRFSKYTVTRTTPIQEIADSLVAQSSDVYAISCYLWNIGLVKSLVATLQAAHPNAYILLGGPQVMHHASEYLSREYESTLICNGEGEKTFANLLRNLTEVRPDFSKIRGLSFYSDGTLVTTGNEPRMQSLDEIPSPYLTGLFDGDYDWASIETNRGCPFHCGFCFWGAATNDKVIKFSEDRILEDISWISKKKIPFLYLCDANWGMLKRDVEISRHIAQCKQENGVPIFVYFSAAKNSPQRVTQLMEAFTAADLVSAQPISMQSLSAKTLELVERKNIKLSAYEILQRELNEKEISSFIEMIWPLPGETLSSFQHGIDALCRNRAATIVIYPHLLLHNTPIFEERDRHELVSRTVSDGAAEAEIVIQTADVTNDEFEEGMRFVYCILALYNARALRTLSEYLITAHGISYQSLYASFIEFTRNHPDDPFVEFRELSIATAEFYDIFNYPKVYHLVGHENREDFDFLLYRFASMQLWWQDENARLLFELDTLSRPYLYSNTPIGHSHIPMEIITSIVARDRGYAFKFPKQYVSLVKRFFGNGLSIPEDGDLVEIDLDHDRGQRPYHSRQSPQHNADYCNGMIMRADGLMPVWATRHWKKNGSVVVNPEQHERADQ